MLQKVINLYSFDELEKEVQNKIIDKAERQDWFDYIDYDRRKALEKFEQLFKIEVTSYDLYCELYDFKFDGQFNYCTLDEGVNEMSPIRFRTWFINNFYHSIYSPKYKHHYKGKSIYSKYEVESCCPLTGCCYDYDVLNPIYLLIEGKQLFESYEELMDCCLAEFFKSWYEENEYVYSEKHLTEHFEENGIMFLKNGVEYDEEKL